MSIREEKIDAGVALAGTLIGDLLKLGDINPRQAAYLVAAAVKGVGIHNATDQELRASAKRTNADLPIRRVDGEDCTDDGAENARR
jgi:hypothetical protein